MIYDSQSSIPLKIWYIFNGRNDHLISIIRIKAIKLSTITSIKPKTIFHCAIDQTRQILNLHEGIRKFLLKLNKLLKSKVLFAEISGQAVGTQRERGRFEPKITRCFRKQSRI